MRVKKVELKNYKRFKHLCIELPEQAKLVILTGPNGCGKSSIFEAFNTWSKALKTRQDGNIYEQDAEYHLISKKDLKLTHHALHDNIKIELHNIADKPVFVIRSAYRCSTDFQLSQFHSSNHTFDQKAPARLIDIDIRVEDNYREIISNSISNFYNPKNDDALVKPVREKIIGKIRDALCKILPNLILSSLGENPLVNGTFRFTKGEATDFHYKNLSGGEKAVLDLLLDFIIKGESVPNIIYCIDEPELHMHTKIQAKFLEVLFDQIPENSQLWLATHSAGMIRKAVDLWKENKQQVAFIDLHDQDLDALLMLKPISPSQNFWKAVFDTNLGDLAKLILPKLIIFCEGTPKDNKNNKVKNKEFDAEVYNIIFSNSYPDTQFVSLGSQSEVKSKGLLVAGLLNHLTPDVKIIRLIDRDDHNDQEIVQYKSEGIRILQRRSIESYLWDNEIVRKLFLKHEKIDVYQGFVNAKEEKLAASKIQDNPPDCIKSIAGELYNLVKRQLSLAQSGSNASEFAKQFLAPLITEETETYKEIESILFENID